MAQSRQVFICAAKRTAFGAFGGSLKGLSAIELGDISSRAAIKSIDLDPAKIDSVVFGNVMQTSADAAFLPRHIGLKAGIPIAVPALGVNRLCGSGFQAVINAAQEVLLGDASIVLCGGAESMSQSPFVLRNVRFGIPLGADIKLEDSLWGGLTDSYVQLPMGITAEKLGAKYGITRLDADEAALASQTRFAQAQADGAFADEVIPVEVQVKKKTVTVSVDEGPRATTIEKLQSLKPVFKKNGIVTAGNASGITDGAASLIVASGEAVAANNLTPLARIASYSYVGVDPEIMGIGPAPAIRMALEKAGLTLNDMSLVEVNEAFAAQFCAVEKDLGLDRSIANVCGGAVALGHPLAASGARITAHLTHQLRRKGAKYGVGAACIGGGQGVAILLENCQ